MISLKYRLLGAVATVALLVALYVIGAQAIALLRDDPDLISQAQSACIRLAKAQLSKVLKTGEPIFGEAANVSSDPTHNAFEFHWTVEENTMRWNPPEAAESVKFGGRVGCSGYAETKIITHLIVGDDTLVKAAGETFASALSY
jgi:hypothetical protein